MKELIFTAMAIIGVAFADTVITNKDGTSTTVKGDAVKIEITPTVVNPPPPPATQGYPFGSHKVKYVAGIKPAVDQAAQDAAVKKLYDQWKVSLKPAPSECALPGGYYVPKGDRMAVSEGIAYGMLITVVMEGYDPKAKEYFDGLYKFARKFPAYGYPEPHRAALMEWDIATGCKGQGGGWPALDGDLDIAMALLMADKQWGSSGAINYLSEAKKTIAAMKAHLINPTGYTAGGPAPDLSRTSDYMITHFRAFKKATGDVFWDTVINKSFELMNRMQSAYSPTAGLIPDFIVGLPNNPAPSPGGRIESATEGFYAWNACRIPWRLGSDYVTSGDTRSRDVAAKIMTFMRNQTGNSPTAVRAGYMLDGKVMPDGGWNSMSFTGPLVAGALVSADNQTFLNNLWNFTTAQLAGGYYDKELQLLSVIVASGNWWNPYDVELPPVTPPVNPPVSGPTVYVSPTGSDTNDGSQTRPFKTIGKAASMVSAGYTVRVLPGVYAERIVSNRDGAVDKRIRFVSEVKWGAKIRPSGLNAESIWENGGDHVDIEGFEVDGSLSQSGVRIGIYAMGNNVNVKGNYVHHIHTTGTCTSQGGAGIIGEGYRGEINQHIIGNLIHDAGPPGCTFDHGIYHTGEGKIINNVVYKASGAAIHLWHDPRRILIANNTVSESGHGIVMGGGDFYNTTNIAGDFITVANNIIVNNKTAVWAGGQLGNNNKFVNNLLFGNSSGWQLGKGTPVGTINADPQFVGVRDFKLKSTSPAINKSDASFAPADDFDGVVRSGGADLGAYELK